MSMYIIPTASVSDILYSTRALSSASNQLAGMLGVGQLNHSNGVIAVARTNLTNTSGLYLYKGTVPTASEFKAGIANSYSTGMDGTAGLTQSFKAADQLVQLRLRVTPQLPEEKMITLLGSASISTAAGLASYFILYFSPIFVWTAGPVYAMMGTVSDLSGNGDLKLNTTQITAGQSVDIKKIQIPLPTEFKW